VSSPLADSPYAFAREMERRSRTEQPREMERVMRGGPRRTPEAQADIAAARVMSDGSTFIHDSIELGIMPREVKGCPTPGCGFQAGHMDQHPCGQPQDLNAALSNAALADTPAMREMGGPRDMRADLAAAIGALDQIHRALWPYRDPLDVTLDDLIHGVVTLKIEREEARQHGERTRLELEQVRHPDAVVLTGADAANYRALVAAARKAQASAATARADGAALLQLFQAFCAGLAPGKES
jgi:hypothetical protein